MNTNFLSKIPPPVYYVIGGLIIVYMLFGGKSTTQKEAEERENKLSDDIDAEIEKSKNMGLKASHSDSEYKNMADAIYQAVKGFGTDEETIKLKFALLFNDLDFLNLQKAFGYREGKSLFDWLFTELGDDDKAVINYILNARGIHYNV